MSDAQQNLCASGYSDISGWFWNSWSTANTAVATVVAGGTHTAVGVGSTTSHTSALVVTGQQRLCPAFLVNVTGNDIVPPKVTLSNSPVVPIGKTIPITATVKPSSNTIPITMTKTTQSGTGSATFVNGATTMTITTTTVLNVIGVSASSTANNIKLTATAAAYGELANTTFTVTKPLVEAIPVNFRQTSGTVLGDTLQFTYNWDSSSGNKADLSTCHVEEYVTYVGPNPLPWASPPY